jgi:hypothetical protein
MKDDLWKDVVSKVNEDYDEIWKINKEFLDVQFKQKKEFFLSHPPVYDKSFYAREIKYIEKDLKGNIKQINDKLWKVEW